MPPCCVWVGLSRSRLDHTGSFNAPVGRISPSAFTTAKKWARPLWQRSAKRRACDRKISKDDIAFNVDLLCSSQRACLCAMLSECYRPATGCFVYLDRVRAEAPSEQHTGDGVGAFGTLRAITEGEIAVLQWLLDNAAVGDITAYRLKALISCRRSHVAASVRGSSFKTPNPGSGLRCPPMRWLSIRMDRLPAFYCGLPAANSLGWNCMTCLLTVRRSGFRELPI